MCTGSTLVAGATHYDMLELGPSATTTEVKKFVRSQGKRLVAQLTKQYRRFYELSKKHHPDRNRNNPAASNQFVKIAIAYSVLGNAKSRAKYDYEMLSDATGYDATRIRNTSTWPAGVSSGKNSQSRKPPSSFFKNSGFGKMKGKIYQSSGCPRVSSGRFGVGCDTIGMYDDVPHFNFKEKQRMYEQQSRRWAEKRKSLSKMAIPGITFPVLAITGILVFTVFTATFTDVDRDKQENLQNRG